MSGGSVWDTIQACDTTRVSISGATVTIKPHYYLMSGVQYYVEIGNQCFANGSNYYAGISGSGTWSFTVTPGRTICKTTASTAGCMTLSSDGTIYYWGDNSRGGAGDGTTTQRDTSVQVHGVGNSGFLTGVVDIASGGYFNGTTYLSTSYALKSDGTVYAWGNNDSGQLGINTSDTNAHSTPVQVVGVGGSGNLSGIVAIRADLGAYCVALTNTGTVYAWGQNDVGELGDGTTQQRNAPVQVVDVGGSGSLSNVVKIQMDDHGFSLIALKGNGTVYDWGINDCHRQLGASVSSSATPVQVTTYLDRIREENVYLIYLSGTPFVAPILLQ